MNFKHPVSKTIGILSLTALLFVAGCGSREQRAQGYYERAMALLEKGDIPKARIEFRNALKINDGLVAAWRGMAKLEEGAQAWPAVVGALRRVVELDPKDVASAVKLGKLQFAAGAVDDALKVVNVALDAEPKNTSAMVLRAAILLRLRDNQAAVQEAHKVLGIEPANLDAMIVLAAEKFSRGDSKGALSILDDVPAAQKDELSVLFLKIRIFERLGDTTNIEAVLRSLIAKNPKEASFQRELIKLYVANKRLDDAEKAMRALAAQDAADAKLGMELVGFLQAVKGPEAARAELARKIAAGGRVFPYQLATAELEYALGNQAESVKSLETLISGLKDAADVATARTRLAEVHLARKNVAAAEAVVADILKTDARNNNGLKLRATIRLERGQTEEAITDLRQALNDQPRSAELLSLLAVAFERNGSIDLADKQLSDAMRASNFNPRYGMNYVAFLQRRGITAHAENVLVELASRNPGNAQILSSLAQLKLQKQDWAGAQEIAEAVRAGNQGPIADQISAAVLAGQQKYDESLGLLKSAYESSPNAVQPMYALVRGYLQAKQPEKAEAFLDSVLKANPSSAEAHVLLGMTKLAGKTPDVAAKSFNAAIESQPKSPLGYAALADFHIRKKDIAAAEKVLLAGLREQPEAFGLRVTYAGLLEQKGDFEAAITEYEKLLKDQPGSMVVANNLASLLTDRRSDQASKDRAYTVALSLAKSQVPQFKDTLGWIYYQRGDHKNAIPLLEEAAAALPNNAWVRYHLGMAYAAAAAGDKAAEQLNKALELSKSDADLTTKVQAALKK